MAVPAWQPGTLYLPGAIVVPQTAAQVSTVTLQNPGFESGNGTGWTISGATPSFSKLHPYAGTYTCTFYTSDGDPTLTYEALNDENPSCAEGAVVTATLAVKLATQGIASARAVIVWYDGVGVEIDRAEATLLERPTPNDGNYVISTVNGVAPVGTASCKCGVTGTVGDGGDVRLDAMTLKFQQAGLMYKAVQPAQGTSDSAEPAWPAVLGATVVDNTVTWEAILLSIVTWQASPIAVSGATEPTWPTTPLERVTDGTVAWECFTRAVEDENCPRTKVVAIMSAKVFAADGDIVRFSATANPLNWSDEQDAGYLPTGLQQANANDMAVLAPYRANLVGLNASSFQNWQVDPDPASMALLDQMDGIGSTWHKAAVPVANDLFYLSQLGVRTVGIAAGAENLAAGDVGMPIDSLVQEALAVIEVNGGKALATYYPSAGQYWLAFPEPEPPPPMPTGTAFAYQFNNLDATSANYLKVTVGYGVIDTETGAPTILAKLAIDPDNAYTLNVGGSSHIASDGSRLYCTFASGGEWNESGSIFVLDYNGTALSIEARFKRTVPTYDLRYMAVAYDATADVLWAMEYAAQPASPFGITNNLVALRHDGASLTVLDAVSLGGGSGWEHLCIHNGRCIVYDTAAKLRAYEFTGGAISLLATSATITGYSSSSPDDQLGGPALTSDGSHIYVYTGANPSWGDPDTAFTFDGTAFVEVWRDADAFIARRGAVLGGGYRVRKHTTSGFDEASIVVSKFNGAAMTTLGTYRATELMGAACNGSLILSPSYPDTNTSGAQVNGFSGVYQINPDDTITTLQTEFLLEEATPSASNDGRGMVVFVEALTP